MSSKSGSTAEQLAPTDFLQQIRETNLSRQPRVTFPLPHFPTETGWRHGRVHHQQEFGGPRMDQHTKEMSRRHAGVDLEAPIGTPVLAMADGIVLRIDKFYELTSEIDVLHPGIGIIRYGEVDRRWASFPHGIKDFVRQGEPIAIVGQRTDNQGRKNPRAMLHLEFFTDDSRATSLGNYEKNGFTQGPSGTMAHLTFQRRSDMIDPTDLVASAPLWSRPLPNPLTTDALFPYCFRTQAPMSRVEETMLQQLIQHAGLF